MRSSRYAIRQRRGGERSGMMCGRYVGGVWVGCRSYVSDAWAMLGDVLAVRRQCVGSAWARVCGVWKACGRCVCVCVGRVWAVYGQAVVVGGKGLCGVGSVWWHVVVVRCGGAECVCSWWMITSARRNQECEGGMGK